LAGTRRVMPPDVEFLNHFMEHGDGQKHQIVAY